MSHASPPQPSVPLGDRQRALLDFERRWWEFDGGKEVALREQFGLSPADYYRELNTLIDLPAALEHDPLLVRRMQRMRESRQRVRSERRLGGR